MRRNYCLAIRLVQFLLESGATLNLEIMRIALRSQEALAPLQRPLRGHETGCLGGVR